MGKKREGKSCSICQLALGGKQEPVASGEKPSEMPNNAQLERRQHELERGGY